MRRIALIVIAAVAPFGMSSAQERSAPQANRGAQFKIDARVQVPKILAVRTHHDMCPYCKQLKPQFEKLGERVIGEPVLLVTLDLSTPATQQQAALVTGALGLDSVWRGDLSRIGTVTILDAKSKKVLAEFKADGDGSLDAVMQTALRIQLDEP